MNGVTVGAGHKTVRPLGPSQGPHARALGAEPGHGKRARGKREVGPCLAGATLASIEQVFVDVAPEIAAEIGALEVAAVALASRLDPDLVPAQAAADLYARLDRAARAITAARTLLARRVDDSLAWQRAGCRNAAEYLAGATGSSLGAARSELETSQALPTLPDVRDALVQGTVSAAQGAVIADAARVNPGAASALVAAAERSNLGELREAAGRAKAAADADPTVTYDRIHRARRMSRFTDGEGGWNLIARGTADAGAVLNSALDPIIDELFRANRTGEHLSRDAYAFDALVELARRACGASKPEKAINPRFLGLLRLDVEALRRGHVEGDELCEITGIGPVPVERAIELLGEATLKLVLTKGVDVANVTSLGRGPTAAMRYALAWTSPTCTVEGCSRTHLETDHRIEYAATQHTRLSELDPLCDGHHDLKTYTNWALVEGKGKRAFVPPDDPRHPRYDAALGRAPFVVRPIRTHGSNRHRFATSPADVRFLDAHVE